MKTKKTEMAEIWNKLNIQLTAAERRKFNEWRRELYYEADRQRDLMRLLTVRTPHRMESAEKIDETVCKIPRFEK